MTRRALGRGRLLVVTGAIAAVAGMFLPWWVVARTGLTPLSGNGFQGAGIVVFLAALALLALVTLPFASRDGQSGLDRAAVYAVVAAGAIGAFLFRVYEISQFGGLGQPAQLLGLWLTGAGLLIVAWGVGDIMTERPPTY
ncbi:MAG: hypothetical protein ACR2H0_03960 [Candidatus Limnocylindrales bacterium]